MNISIKQRRKIGKWCRAMLFVAPALLCYIIFSIIPIFNTIELSFYEWDGASALMNFVGLDNYKAIFQNEIFLESPQPQHILDSVHCFYTHNFWYYSGSIAESEFCKRQTFIPGYFYMPAIVSMVAVGIVWNWILNPEFGILNRALKFIGLDFLAFNWLGDEHTVMWALLIAGSWVHYGFCMVITMAALSGLDACYVEAAKLEGANPVQTFFLCDTSPA